MNTSNRTRALVATAGLVLALGVGTAAVLADGDDSDDRPIPAEPDGGIGDTPGDQDPVDHARDDARGLLGRNQDDLPDEVRVGRKGDEQFALIENYVVGRLTVELDDDGDGYRVTSVTVELPDGPETFHLATG